MGDAEIVQSPVEMTEAEEKEGPLTERKPFRRQSSIQIIDTLPTLLHEDNQMYVSAVL